MNKPKRVILLLTEILMLVAGLVGVLIFCITTTVVVRGSTFSDFPSANAINATTNVARLQSMANEGYEKMQVLAQAMITLRWYFLGLGIFLFFGSIIHFSLTPWKIHPKDDEVV